MFNYNPSPTQITNGLRTEFDPRSPKLRLSVMAYLLEHKVRPGNDLTVDAFIETIDLVTKYVASDLDGFIETIQALPVEDKEEDVKTENPDDFFGGNTYI